MEHDFDLILEVTDGIPLPDLDRLYRAAGDATLSQQGGVWRLSFTREAPTASAAIALALRDLAEAGFTASVEPQP